MRPHTAWSGSMFVRRLPDPRIRHVGNYAYNFTASTTASVNIPSTDLQYKPGPYRQIIIATGYELNFPISVSIDGITSNMMKVNSGRFINITGAQNSRADGGDIPVVITTSSVITEAGSIVVFELEYAAPFRECLVIPNASELHMPNRSVGLIAAYNGTEGATFTFSATGFTEVVDIDAGAFRMGAALAATPAVGNQHVAVTVTPSGGTAHSVCVAFPPLDDRNVRGGSTGVVFTVASADPQTFANNAVQHMTTAGLGKGKLILAILVQTSGATPNSVTWGGEAMTSVGTVVAAAADQTTLSLWEMDFDEQVNPGGAIVVDWSAAPGRLTSFARFIVYNCKSYTAQTGQGNAAAGTAFSVDTVKGSAILAFMVRGTSTQTATYVGVAEINDQTNVDTEYSYSYGARFCCDPETGRTVQATGSASGSFTNAVMVLNP